MGGGDCGLDGWMEVQPEKNLVLRFKKSKEREKKRGKRLGGMQEKW